MMYIITHESHKLNQMCQRGIIMLQEQDHVHSNIQQAI
jgi:hypothetical protein